MWLSIQGKLQAVDTATAIEYAQMVYLGSTKNGLLQDYRYLISDTEQGAMILFLDCGRFLDSFRTLLASYVLVSAVGTYWF